MMLNELSRLMADGGPVMWPLGAMSLFGCFIVLREFGRYAYFTRCLNTDTLSGILALVAGGNRLDAANRCTADDPVTRMFHAALTDPSGDAAGIDPNLHAGASAIALLATIAGTAPLLGILGTVLGIVQSFNALGGMTQLKMAVVASGISHALISTAAGLVVSLCTLVPHNLLVVIRSRWEDRTLAWGRRLESAMEKGERS